MPDTKECSRCGEEKPSSEFYKDSYSSDGLKSYCKVCSREALREWQEENREHNRKYQREYMAEQQESWENRDPYEVHDTAVCSECDEEKEAEAFRKNLNTPKGLRAQCRECVDKKRKEFYHENKEKERRWSEQWRRKNRDYYAARQAERREQLRDAMPGWVDEDAIQDVYAKAQWLTNVTGVQHEVDHIDPVNHNRVCGLHVQANLQILTQKDNATKNDQFNLGAGNKSLARRGVDYAGS